jgi:hypothetical protein
MTSPAAAPAAAHWSLDEHRGALATLQSVMRAAAAVESSPTRRAARARRAPPASTTRQHALGRAEIERLLSARSADDRDRSLEKEARVDPHNRCLALVPSERPTRLTEDARHHGSSSAPVDPPHPARRSAAWNSIAPRAPLPLAESRSDVTADGAPAGASSERSGRAVQGHFTAAAEATSRGYRRPQHEHRDRFD